MATKTKKSLEKEDNKIDILEIKEVNDKEKSKKPDIISIKDMLNIDTYGEVVITKKDMKKLVNKFRESWLHTIWYNQYFDIKLNKDHLNLLYKKEIKKFRKKLINLTAGQQEMFYAKIEKRLIENGVVEE